VKKTAVKVLVPILALLMLLSMASSVRAGAPPTKTAITAVIVTVSFGTTAKYVVSPWGIEYLLYVGASGTLAIFAGTYSYSTVVGKTPIAIVSFVDDWWGTYNIATNLGSYTAYEVWSLSSAAFVGFDHPVNTVGDLISDISGYPAATSLSSHIIVYGISAHAGQFIDIASPDLLATPWTGYWLTP